MFVVKKLFVFKYSDMRLGGIQNILYNHVKYCLKRNIQVMWIIPHKTDIHNGFKDVINENDIIICNEKQVKRILPSLIDENTRVLSYSFGLKDFLYMSKALSYYHTCECRNYFVISNFQGPNIFLEENVKGRERIAAFDLMKKFYSELGCSGQLLFCASKQADALQEHYRIKLCQVRIIALTKEENFQLNEEVLKRRFESRNILTVSRFDFPHKAYVLGLIDAFSEVQKQITDSELTIIGYGSGDVEVKKKISLLDVSVQDKITVIPGVSPTELESYFNNAMAFIGVAGALGNAASCGLVSLVARHFCPECEVYGYYSQNSDKVISDEPGEYVVPYIKKLLDMPYREYTIESHRTMEMYLSLLKNRPNDFTNDYPIEKPITIHNERLKELDFLVYAYSNITKKRRARNFIKSPLYNVKRILKRYI